MKTDYRQNRQKKNEFYSANYKTKPCEYYRKGIAILPLYILGNCQKGDECPFSHNFPREKLDVIQANV